MNTTQGHLAISDISDNVLILKNGGGALVLQVSAVNFGLLSGKEQMAIIGSFAQMLNSLSFSIQIVIHSERLNISSYLQLLDKAQKAQTNPLLSQMIVEYKQFIQSTIKENEVLDKKFYLVIPLSNLELGIAPSKQTLEQKIKTVLLPRRDQMIRQLSRVGLKANQLSRQKLIEVFYDIYNGEFLETPTDQQVNPEQLLVKLNNPQPIAQQPLRLSFDSAQDRSRPTAPQSTQQPPTITQNTKTHPFVVEELE